MTTNRSLARPRRLWAVVAVLALAVGACGNSGDDETATEDTTATTEASTDTTEATDEFVSLTDVPGVTDEEIHFAAFGTQANNPLGTCVLDCYTEGIEAYFAFRNSEGGVHGRQMVLSTVLDDELTQQPGARPRDRVGQRHLRRLQRHAGRQRLGRHRRRRHAPLHLGHPLQRDQRAGSGIFRTTAMACASCPGRGGSYVATLAGATRIATLGYGVSQNSKDCANARAPTRRAVRRRRPAWRSRTSNDDLEFGLPERHRPRGDRHAGRRRRLHHRRAST